LKCASSLEHLPKPCCPVCSGSITEEICPDCSDREVYYDRNISLYRYEGSAEKLIRALKFSGRRDLASFIGSESASFVVSAGCSPDIITFIPAVPSRERSRGYNQSKLIAEKLSSRLGIPVQRLLLVNEHGDQKKMHFNERFLNILGRFEPAGGADIRGKKILIVDDVFTTGATVNEAARILKKMGARMVFSLTIARVAVKKS